MKWLRILVLAAFVGPLFAKSADVCCAASEEASCASLQADACAADRELQTSDHDCDEEDACAECDFCHAQSFSPDTPGAHSLRTVRRHILQVVNAVPLIVAAVLTPPPTL